MKKLLFFALLALFTLVIVGHEGWAAKGSKAIAIALKVKGKVDLVREGRTSKLGFGTPLDDGDVIRTGKEGFVTVMFTDDKSMIKLTEYTEVTIEGKRGAEGAIAKRVSMEIGELFAKVEKQRGTMEVATPTSVASVKGTEFWVIVDENGNTFIVTLEGLIDLINRLTGQGIQVAAAQRGEVDNQGNMNLQDVDPEDLPQDPDPERDEGPTRTIEIDLRDEEGNVRTIEIQYREPEGGE